MASCRQCGETFEKGSEYCPQCGEPNQLNPNQGDVALEDFHEVIDGLIDGAINHISADLPDIDHDVRIDQFEFAIEMYVIGYVKGQVSTALGFAAIQDGGSYPEDASLQPLNQYIVERVQERSNEIREQLQRK